MKNEGLLREQLEKSFFLLLLMDNIQIIFIKLFKAFIKKLFIHCFLKKFLKSSVKLS